MGETGAEAARLYREALEGFGGTTSELLEDKSAPALMECLRSHIQKLPNFMGGAIDFGALAGATNFAKMLVRGGYGHTEDVAKESLAGPSELGGTFDGLRKSMRNFMTTF